MTVQDGTGSPKLDKEKETGRIDVILAAVMAAAIVIRATEPVKSFGTNLEIL